jgi:predicted MFS family arabinose efflux permease
MALLKAVNPAIADPFDRVHLEIGVTGTRKEGTPGRPGDFRLFSVLAAGYSFSSFGTYLNMVALSLFVYHVTGRATETGLFLAIRLVSGVICGTTVGALANRVDRRLVMAGSDATLAVSLVAFVLSPSSWQGILCFPLAALLGAGGNVSAVLLRSSVPAMVGDDRRVRANGFLVTGRSAAMTLGFASAGVIVSLAGFTTAFLVDAVTYFASASILLWLPLEFRTRSATGHTPGAAKGLRHARALAAAAPVLAFMLVVRGLDAFGSASHNVGIPVFASTAHKDDPAAFMSLFWTSWAVGSLLAYRVFGRFVRGDGDGEFGFAFGTCMMSTFFILAFTGLPLYALVPVAIAAGLSDGYTEISYNSRLQTVPEAERGRVFGLSSVMESGGMGIGMLLSSALLDIWSPLAVVGLSHGTAIALAGSFLVFSTVRRGVRRAPAADTPEGG